MRRHDFDPLSLVFGLVFAAVGLALLGGDPARGSLALPWAGPAVGVAIAALVVLSLRPPRVEPGADEPPEAAS